MLQTAAAVILANGVTAAFIFALVSTWQKQTKQNVSDTDLPLWIYPCLIIAPVLMAFGFYLIPAP